MSSSGEKTEQPTPKKMRDAREKGQVARSQEVVTAVSLFGVIAVIIFMGMSIFQEFIRLIDVAAQLATRPDRDSMIEGIGVMWDAFLGVLIPILGAVVLFAVAANFAQFGILFAFSNLMPKLDNVSPAKGIKKIFSMKQLVEILKSIIKIVFLSILLYIVIQDAIGPYIVSVYCGMPCLLTVTNSMLMWTLGFTALAFTIVAAADFTYQKHTHIKGLMMSKDEVKREYKESEGDPLVKSQRRSLAQELVMSDGPTQARKATAVVINPTHLAVALRYDAEKWPLPIVVAKGRNLHAATIRAAAEGAGVPIFRNVPLARTLFEEARLGEPIPDEAFVAVAEVLAWVERFKDSLYAGPLDHGVIELGTAPD